MRSAVVALVGRPSAGKSTLVNALCGGKVSIVSPVPQTTRRQVRGIATRRDLQLVLLDTPGLYQSNATMNLYLRSEAARAIQDADVLFYILDRSRPPGSEEGLVREIVLTAAKPTLVIVNKSDLPARGDWDEFLRPLGQLPQVRVSALTGEGLDVLWETARSLAPEAPFWYPTEYYTDQEPSFRVAEIIREQAIHRLEDELPHDLYVEIVDLENRRDGELLWVRATIVVERESQVGIVVGRGGGRIREIRVASQALLEQIFERKVFLDLRVKAAKGWKTDARVLQKLFGEQTPQGSGSG